MYHIRVAYYQDSKVFTRETAWRKVVLFGSTSSSPKSLTGSLPKIRATIVESSEDFMCWVAVILQIENRN